MGPSGSGKTTLLTIAGALLRPTRGVWRCGTNVTQMSETRLAFISREKVRFVYQSFDLLEALTALETNKAVVIVQEGGATEPVSSNLNDGRCSAVDSLLRAEERLEDNQEDDGGGHRQRQEREKLFHHYRPACPSQGPSGYPGLPGDRSSAQTRKDECGESGRTARRS